MNKDIVVVSLFDGISVGQIALTQLGYNVTYYASEIDETAIEITKRNFPDTIHIGDVTKVSYDNGILKTEVGDFNIGHVDMVIGGSPCTGFSKAGKKLNFEDPQSKLFFDWVRIKDEINPTYFLLENVEMKKDHVNVITEYVGEEPVYINSALLSSQNRPRIYWSNIDFIVPEDKGLHLTDIIDYSIPDHKTNIERLSTSFFSELGLLEFHTDSVCCTTITRFKENKDPSIAKRWIKKRNETIVIRNHKHGTLTTSNSYLIKINGPDYDINKPFENCQIRNVSAEEAEKLQTIPVGYTSGYSKTKRIKALGNSWTVEVIKHIFNSI